MSRKIATFAIAICLSQLVLSVAGASELTREEYVDRAEPICKANTTANRHILKGIRVDVRKGRLKLAGGKFSRAAQALDQTIKQLEQIPRPSADEGLLARWFTHLNGETKMLEKIARRLLKGNSVHLGQYVLELRHNANATNNIVLTFGFEYCLIQTAKFI
jgi:hypothetical protein